MINKKQICLAFILLGIFNLSFAGEEHYNSPEYSEIEYSDDINFEAINDNGKIKLSWDNYKGNDFKWYKVMKSSNSNPTYPEESAFKVITDQYDTNVEDNNYNGNKTYYRVCIITQENDRICSKVVEHNGGESIKKEYKNNLKKYSKEVEDKLKYYSKKFIDKIEKADNKMEKAEFFIEKLEIVGKERKNLKFITEYIIEEIKVYIEKLDSDEGFKELENLLDL